MLFESLDDFRIPTDPAVADPGGTPLPTADPQRMPQVPQSEHGVPLSQWSKVRTTPARRPDGSIVQVKATNIVAGLEPDPDPDADRAESTVADPASPPTNSSPTVTASTAPSVRFAHPGVTLVPSGEKSRARANIAALQIAARCVAEGDRPATRDEQTEIAQWSGWGAVPSIFDERNTEWAGLRDQLRTLLSEQQYREARASTLNAHYTDPTIAGAMWSALGRSGFTGGLVLEPGCGSGNFIGQAPSAATMVGVEIEPATAQIARLLYPDAQIRNEGFEQTRVPEGSFAAAIGNVPFGGFAVHDPVHNPRGHNIHNHFILKTLSLTAPGGYAVLLTSAGTLDAQSDAARRDMYALADLVGAVRLPSNAFTKVAGTQVVTDVLVLRRRADGEIASAPPEIVDWVQSVNTELPGREDTVAVVPYSEYFANHPTHVLGEPMVSRGLYRDGSLVVQPRHSTAEELAHQLEQVLTEIVDAGVARGLGFSARPTADVQFSAGLATGADLYADQVPIGHVSYDPTDDGFNVLRVDGPDTLRVPEKRRTETRHLLRLRDITGALIGSQRADGPAAERDALRAELNEVYDAYLAAYGPINRYRMVGGQEPSEDKAEAKYAQLQQKWRTANGDDDLAYAGPIPDSVLRELQERAWAPSPVSRRQTHLEALRKDPDIAAVLALEIFDEATGTPRKSAIFSRDVVTSPVPAQSAESAADALAISLGESGHVDLQRIADLIDVSPDEAREQLRGLVFASPGRPDELIAAPAALSGNIRTKLDEVKVAIDNDPANPNWHELHDALNAVLPTPVGASRIAAEVKPGPTWIAPSDYATFIKDVFGANSATVERGAGRWSIDIRSSELATQKMRTDYGADNVEIGKRRTAVDLFSALLNQEPIVVRNSKQAREENGAPEVDQQATILAQVQAEKILTEFRGWLFADDERAERLTDVWNRRFNSWVRPRHDGSRLMLPGLAPTFTPHPYQRDAVSRILAEPTVLLDHVVGAGKTGTMFMAAIELKRRGLVSQPWLVVPTHLIEQFGREVKQWYPGARVLLGQRGMDSEDRRMFAAQTATTDFDMVIVPSSVFELIRVSPERQARYVEAQLDEIDAEKATVSSEATIKNIERAKKTLKKRLEKALDQSNKDTGVLFEDTGCDYLFVDEAHEYKNKGRTCTIESLSLMGSNKAEDLAMKLQVLRDRRQDQAAADGVVIRPGAERVATFATGTPIANSLAEAWVMQQYLRPDVLEEAGVRSITDWAATFTTTRSETITNTTGTKLKVVSRVSQFANPRQLSMMCAQYTDIVLRDQVPATLPRHDGRQITTTVPTQEVRDFIADLEYRLDNPAGEHNPEMNPQIDNTLKVLNDGRNAALDPRLVNLELLDPSTLRTTAVADQVADVYHRNAERIYLDSVGSKAPVAGAFQMVFADRGTPQPGGGFTLYAGLRDALIERGIPGDQIAFIHDAKSPAQKLELQADCRSGRISVLIGSTPKMGTGMNVQDRLVALHHLDVPWRPADLEQREGRIIRQGNQNDHIDLFTYVTEGTTDTVMWGKVESKAVFIEQFRAGNLDDLTAVDDVESNDSLADAAAATKAAATGDERFMRMAELGEEVRKLSALEAAHIDSRRSAQRSLSQIDRQLPLYEAERDTLGELAGKVAAWDEGGRMFSVDGKSALERPDRGELLLTAAQKLWADLKHSGFSHKRPLVEFPTGIVAYAQRSLVRDTLIVTLDCPGQPDFVVEPDRLFTPQGGSRSATASGMVTRIENLHLRVPDLVDRREREIAAMRAEIPILAPRLDASFEQAGELASKKAELVELRMAIEQAEKSEEAENRRAEAAQRLRAAGRSAGWSLELNPTTFMVTNAGMMTAEDYVHSTMRHHSAQAQAWAAEDAAERGAHTSSVGSLIDLARHRETRIVTKPEPKQSNWGLPSNTSEMPHVENGPELD